jgi:hypothetical protein
MRLTKADYSGDIGYESGEYHETLVTAAASRSVRGHYLLILRNVKGQWLIAEQMWTESPQIPK